MKKHYPIAEPNISSLEKKYVNECLDSGWVSSLGKYIKKFELSYAKFNDSKYAISTCNGTVSLHLIMLALGIKKGDEIIVPNFTYIAPVNVILYVGAKPIFVDCDTGTFNIDVRKIEEKITKKTKAIIAVHLYGNPCDMDKILEIAKKYKIHVIEDAAEAHGATYRNKIIGSFGIANSFSFFGNKTITTGEGGMITTNSKAMNDIIRLLKNQGQHHDDKRYFHRVMGYNYRMTNVQAAIGLAQLKNIKKLVSKKRQINRWYRQFLSPAVQKRQILFQKETKESKHSYWMNAIIINNSKADTLSSQLKKIKIETRPFFAPINEMPYIKDKNKFPNSRFLYENGLILPSGATLSKNDIKFISESILKIINI